MVNGCTIITGQIVFVAVLFVVVFDDIECILFAGTLCAGFAFFFFGMGLTFGAAFFFAFFFANSLSIESSRLSRKFVTK
jgi:hypothetical protein